MIFSSKLLILVSPYVKLVSLRVVLILFVITYKGFWHIIKLPLYLLAGLRVRCFFICSYIFFSSIVGLLLFGMHESEMWEHFLLLNPNSILGGSANVCILILVLLNDSFPLQFVLSYLFYVNTVNLYHKCGYKT